MATYILCPLFNGQTIFTTFGLPASGGTITTYLAGTTTAATTFKTISGTANTNPIVLNAAGQLNDEIWLDPLLSYKFVVHDVLNNIIGTFDNISGIGSSPNNIFYNQGGTGAVSRTLQSKEQDTVSAKDFGAVGDGITDDTVALQAFVTYIVANSQKGYVPAGTYIISSALIFPKGGNYSFIGAGKNSTIIKQTTNNIPILSMGGTGAVVPCVFIEIAHMYLSYANSQSGNTSAYAIYLQASYYLNSFHHLRWEGYTGLKVLSGQPAPQNTKFDEIDCTAVTYGSMMDWSGTTNSGPNLVFGRMQIACNNMVGPAFNNLKGVNCNIDCLEFLSATNCNLITLQSGAQISINTMKLEVFTYNTSGSMFIFDNNSNVKINQFFLYGTTGIISPASGVFYLFNSGVGGSNSSLHIDLINLQATSLGSGNVFVFNGQGGEISLNTLITDGNANWLLTNNGSAATSEVLNVANYNNSHVSQDKGNITSYNIALGDPTNIVFNTALTAPCTVTLPSLYQNMFNGLTYRIISHGAVNGANTITINNGSGTLATLSADNTSVQVVWRRANNGPSGWIQTFS